MKRKKNFSKDFDTVNYKILVRNLEKYGIKHQYIDWVKRYLKSWKQYVCYSEGTLLSLIFVDNFQHVANFLNSILFAVETNIFSLNRNIKELLEKVNKELANVTDWCVTNILSINTSKKIIKQTPWDNIPLKLPDLKSNKIILKRVTELKFLDVMTDKNLN